MLCVVCRAVWFDEMGSMLCRSLVISSKRGLDGEKWPRQEGAFLQTDYLHQLLEPYILGILGAFALVTHTLRLSAKPLFMEAGNAAHGHKSKSNCCARFRTKHGIILRPHPSTFSDMNPIEKCWRWIKQSLHRRQHQPTTVEEMRRAITEEWEAIPQEWTNKLILKQEHCPTLLAFSRPPF
jgi:transposase